MEVWPTKRFKTHDFLQIILVMQVFDNKGLVDENLYNLPQERLLAG